VDFGLVIRTPMIEITTIGAGGGSIAWVDESGLLQVGPESAGSDPGPACYGRGDRPTVTDANLALGRINPEKSIGGGRLDVAAARAAIDREVGAKLGLSTLEAAEAVLRLANAKMAGAIRLVSIERGLDPAKFVAMPFGGGGALHAGALMKDVGLAGALVPRFPGVTSALGCAVADMRHDRVRTVNAMLDGLDAGALGAEMMAEAEGLAGLLDASGLGFERTDRVFELDMLYAGQTHTVAASVGIGAGLTREAIREGFEAAYLAAFGRLLPGTPARVVNYRVAVIGRRPAFDMRAFAPVDGRAAADCVTARRVVHVGGADMEAPVYDRLALAVGERVRGPALLEQPDTTIFIDPGLEGRCDAFGNLVIGWEAAT
jgi:N-methylhydantoinase A